MTTRQALHDLVDDLPDDLLGEAEETLARLKAHAVDPLLEALRNAPVDDEPLSIEERARLDRAWEDLGRRPPIPDADLDRLLNG
jgi:hypothetical protein